MIRCLAVDDEPLALAQIKSHIEKNPTLELVDTCQSAFEAADVLKRKRIDAMFIDINMPDLNGMDFVRSLTERPMIVFTTAYSEYAVEGYKVDAVDYLLKPFSKADFQRVADKLLQLSRLKESASGNASPQDEILFIKSGYKNVKVHIADISHIESMNEYLKIFLTGEAKAVVALLSMKKMEDYLPGDMFMRVHRSYMVNLEKIKMVQKSQIILDGDITIPIGDLYKETFNKYLQDRSLK